MVCRWCHGRDGCLRGAIDACSIGYGRRGVILRPVEQTRRRGDGGTDERRRARAADHTGGRCVEGEREENNAVIQRGMAKCWTGEVDDELLRARTQWRAVHVPQLLAGAEGSSSEAPPAQQARRRYAPCSPRRSNNTSNHILGPLLSDCASRTPCLAPWDEMR